MQTLLYIFIADTACFTQKIVTNKRSDMMEHFGHVMQMLITKFQLSKLKTLQSLRLLLVINIY